MFSSSNLVKVNDKVFRKYISERTIQSCVRRIARKLTADYPKGNLLLMPVLNGSFIFAADLVRELNTVCGVSFIKVASYEADTSGALKTLIGINEEVKGKDILLVEDIIDTGKTADYMIKELYRQGAKSVKLAVLLFKPDCLKVNVKIDYIGMEIKDLFVIGYGLDYNGLGRNLKHIYQLVKT